MAKFPAPNINHNLLITATKQAQLRAQQRPRYTNHDDKASTLPFTIADHNLPITTTDNHKGQISWSKHTAKSRAQKLNHNLQITATKHAHLPAQQRTTIYKSQVLDTNRQNAQLSTISSRKILHGKVCCFA